MIDKEIIRAKFADLVKMDANRLADDMEFANLEIDSLSFIDAILALQENFDVALSQEIILEAKTVGELINAIQEAAE